MKHIEDAPCCKEAFKKEWTEFFKTYLYVGPYMHLAEHFFVAGYEAAIAERAKFDQQNELIVKDISEL